MNNWKDLYKNKLSQETSSKFDQTFLLEMRKRMEIEKTKEPLFDWKLLLAPSMAFAMLIFIFISTNQTSYQNPEVYTAIMEKEEILDNLSALSEIDEVENLSDEDWGILLGGEEDV